MYDHKTSGICKEVISTKMVIYSGGHLPNNSMPSYNIISMIFSHLQPRVFKQDDKNYNFSKQDFYI